jgi:hypothetical protein
MRRFALSAFTFVFFIFLCGTGFADSTSDFGQSDKRHDLSPGYFLQFSDKGLTSFSIETEGSGSWAVFGSNTLGLRGALLTYGSGDKVVNLANIENGYSYILVTGRGRGHVALQGEAAVVPEPGSPVLILATGLIGLVEIGRRRMVSLLS